VSDTHEPVIAKVQIALGQTDANGDDGAGAEHVALGEGEGFTVRFALLVDGVFGIEGNG